MVSKIIVVDLPTGFSVASSVGALELLTCLINLHVAKNVTIKTSFIINSCFFSSNAYKYECRELNFKIWIFSVGWVLFL